MASDVIGGEVFHPARPISGILTNEMSLL
jgi:hypothetical protein